jgi:hypothetical protein
MAVIAGLSTRVYAVGAVAREDGVVFHCPCSGSGSVVGRGVE